MKIAVLGGTGRTGQHVVQQALDAGHEVVALARTPSKFTSRHDNLTVVQGGILDQEAVEKVITGVDAVVSTLGPANNKPEFTISKGMDNILGAMNKHKVKRIVISAGAGVREPGDNPKLVDRFFGVLLRIISKNVVADMEQVVEKVKASGLEWTIVRVPMLTNEPPQDNLVVGVVGDIRPRISRADMAAFMLKQLTDDTHLHKSPAISN